MEAQVTIVLEAEAGPQARATGWEGADMETAGPERGRRPRARAMRREAPPQRCAGWEPRIEREQASVGNRRCVGFLRLLLP